MGVEDNNEITVKIKGSIEDLYKTLEKRNYKIVDKFYLDDTYFIPDNIETKEMTTRDILSKAIIIRNIKNDMYKRNNKVITYKRKRFDENGNILKQEAFNCEIINIDDAKKILTAIGYKEIMNIKENDLVYEKNSIELAIKDIVNGDNLIEIETKDIEGFRTIEELKQTINTLDIPIEKDNYFVKKAEIELSKILNSNKDI